uniref:Uncharacterized protein n=1 Tax=Anopheles funestus TaxID=62324 RepID=A0A182S0U6_ANOFN
MDCVKYNPRINNIFYHFELLLVILLLNSNACFSVDTTP